MTLVISAVCIYTASMQMNRQSSGHTLLHSNSMEHCLYEAQVMLGSA